MHTFWCVYICPLAFCCTSNVFSTLPEFWFKNILKMSTFWCVYICPLAFCTTSNAFWTKMNTSNPSTSKLLIFAMKINENGAQWTSTFWNYYIRKVFKRFLNSAQRTFWVAPKASRNPELRSFTKCNKNKWKATNTMTSWPSKLPKWQHSCGFDRFLNSARRTFWVASKASQNPEFRSFTKWNKNKWKATKTLKCWPSKWPKWQYFQCF